MTFPAAGRSEQVAGADWSTAADVVCDESFDAATLHSLRDRVAACAAAAGMPEERVMHDTLAVHELAANAVRHGAGSGRLLMRATGIDSAPWSSGGRDRFVDAVEDRDQAMNPYQFQRPGDRRCGVNQH
jgi:two-component sensor histidine kinase